MTGRKVSVVVACVLLGGCETSAGVTDAASNAAAATGSGGGSATGATVGASGFGGSGAVSSASSGGSGGAPEPVCQPGATEACYTGVPASRGLGPCHEGARTCDADGLSWGPCVGEVIPKEDNCDGIDDDCNGIVDPPDYDGDGWTECNGDCCEDFTCSFAPERINPGAFEYLGNYVDDDCDPTTADDVPPAACDPTPLATPTTALALVGAMDLCRFTVESPPISERTWGVISAELLLADGSPGPPQDLQAGVLAAYGGFVAPKKSSSMAALSTGTARAEGDPGFASPETGLDAQTLSAVPAAYLAAHGGTLPSYVACPPCSGPQCTQAYDSVNLKVRLRAPTNALGFAFAYKLYTAEFPDRPCQPSDDRFVALLTSTSPIIPADKNVAFDSVYNPLSVNDAFLGVCFPQAWPIASGCPNGQLELVGTGMGGTSGDLTDGAGTPWLFADAPVVPGETIDLELVIWDGSDHAVDSLVLLDAFKWSVDPAPMPD